MKGAWHAGWLCLAMSSASFAQADLHFPLPEGLYRFDGRCVEFRDAISDEIQRCGDKLGIVVEKPELPEFYFMTTDGKAWMFPASKLKKAARDGRHAEFAIANFTDLSVGSVNEFDGDCVLDLGQGKLRVECHARRGRKVVRTAIFESVGTFVFSRDKPAQPADAPRP